MKFGVLSQHFVGAGVKRLSGTEVNFKVSRGHEVHGVDDFRAFLGTPGETVKFGTTYIWVDDDRDDPIRVEGIATWYDSRRGKSHRAAEYRLYYRKGAEDAVYRAKDGDTMFLCLTVDRRLLAIFCPPRSSIEQKLLWLFGLSIRDDFKSSQKELGGPGAERDLDLAARLILAEIGIESDTPETDGIGKILKKVSGSFPATAEFSKLARDSLKDVDPIGDPDGALVAWMEHEAALFRHLESEIVSNRLNTGFIIEDEPDVDGFLKFSLSVQNRRKSRAGYAFAHHFEEILKVHDIRYAREATTEKRNAADFLFPGEEEYADQGFPANDLFILGLKTTCKERWRQVLAEADRISKKHLLTLEPAISPMQTEEMRKYNLQLVLPKSLHDTYQPDQKSWLMDVGDFLDLVRSSS